MHSSFMQSSPQLGLQTHRGGSLFSVSCNISHRITNVPTSHSYLNLWRRLFCSKVEKRWKFFGYESFWYIHSQCRRFCYKIIRQVILFPDRCSNL